MENIGSFNEPGAQIGIEIRECTGFKADGNTLFGVDYEDSDIIGILALNTGSENNVIQRDTFIRGIHVANLAEGENRGVDPFKGLQYFCNYNVDENWVDFYVVGEGIAENQGSIFNSFGQQLEAIPVKGVESSFFSGSFPPGLYFISLAVEGRVVQVEKFVRL